MNSTIPLVFANAMAFFKLSAPNYIYMEGEITIDVIDAVSLESSVVNTIPPIGKYSVGASFPLLASISLLDIQGSFTYNIDAALLPGVNSFNFEGKFSPSQEPYWDILNEYPISPFGDFPYIEMQLPLFTVYWDDSNTLIRISRINGDFICWRVA